MRDTWTRAAQSFGKVIVICYGCAGSKTEPDGRTPCRRCGGSGIDPNPRHERRGRRLPPLPPAGHPRFPHPVISSTKEQATMPTLARKAAASQRPAARPNHWVIPHEPLCPDCGSFDVITDEVETGDGLTETAYICTLCGCAWPLACVVEWEANR